MMTNHCYEQRREAAMEASPFIRFPLFPSSPSLSKNVLFTPSIYRPKPITHFFTHLAPVSATRSSPKGFGPSLPKKPNRKRKPRKDYEDDDEDDDDDEDEDEEDDESAGIIPEIVTNRMMKRIGLSVGIPLFIGLVFFPFFYYLKVVLKIDIPTWIPVIVSTIFFGTALLGISYGIVSSSWDPLREGSLLGWNEAKSNWPVFWQSLRGGGDGGRKNNL